MRFYNWFEEELETTAAEALKKVEGAAREKGIPVETKMLVGPTEKLIINYARENPTAFLVLPNPKTTAPAAAAGLKYDIATLLKKIDNPVTIGPN